jgi:hypothetical protein
MMKKSWLVKLFGAFMAIMLITGCNMDDTDNQDQDTNNQGEMQPGDNDVNGNDVNNNDNQEDVVEDPQDANDVDNKDE